MKVFAGRPRQVLVIIERFLSIDLSVCRINYKVSVIVIEYERIV